MNNIKIKNICLAKDITESEKVSPKWGKTFLAHRSRIAGVC